MTVLKHYGYTWRADSGQEHLNQLQDLSRKIAEVPNKYKGGDDPIRPSEKEMEDEVVELAAKMLHLRNEYLDSRRNKALARGQRSVGDGGGGKEDGAENGSDGDDDEDDEEDVEDGMEVKDGDDAEDGEDVEDGRLLRTVGVTGRLGTGMSKRKEQG
ncbi:MAG: hypothetical protein M1839_007911 [Geoglossum umbratile]|nr:MAG: hypothetical protein M1839_007911 [Geoglossum umbratile]